MDFMRWRSIARTGLITGWICANVSSQVMEDFTFSGLHRAIPDGDLAGLADTRNIALSGEIAEVQVSFELAGGYSGDYYAYLTHGTGFSVLLNRVGRRADDPVGYDDAGFNVTFRDDASNGNIHSYRLTLLGSDDVPLAAPGILTGPWVPDGRTTSPLSVLDGDNATAPLGSFKAQQAGGSWTLFIADVSGGGSGFLESWSIGITSVPEPKNLAAAVGLALFCFGAWHRYRGPDEKSDK